MTKFSLKDPIQFFALGFGTGLAPKAPGTFGTIAALPILWLLADVTLPYYLVVTFLFSIAGIFICDYTAKRVGVHDHPAIVWDEVVGYLITMILTPISLTTLVAGFLLFRFFDILKPWPISWLDKHCHGGLGIMLDDIVAGLMALVVMHLIF